MEKLNMLLYYACHSVVQKNLLSHKTKINKGENNCNFLISEYPKSVFFNFLNLNKASASTLFFCNLLLCLSPHSCFAT